MVLVGVPLTEDDRKCDQVVVNRDTLHRKNFRDAGDNHDDDKDDAEKDGKGN